MHESTLFLFYFTKFFELIYLIAITVLVFIQGAQAMHDILKFHLLHQDLYATVLFYLIAAVMLIQVFHLFYTNLLINLRFKIKMNCFTCGKCMYDGCNILFCHCCLHKLCRDKCFTVPTIIKWVILLVVYAATGFFDYQFQAFLKNNTLDYAAEEKQLIETFYFLCALLALQHPLFMLARIPMFILWTLLTCCCDQGREYSENEKFEDRIISYNFVQYELGELNNFEGHVGGREELEFHRNLSIVREARQSIVREAQAQEGASSLQRLRTSLRN